MADVDMAIAGRSYRVACADGQEASLAEAGAMIAREAETLRAQFGSGFNTLSEARVLLMAGLML
ncbi:MAG: cell division protein ZapA, partial [Pseudomonadota bacterium]